MTMQNINILSIFITGLLTGGLTCLAVQGGLLATTIAQREQTKLKKKARVVGNALPIASFLVAKLTAYTILGFLLGWLGSVVQLSLSIKVLIQFAVSFFMIATAFNMLNVHPIFRYVIIQPPKFLTRLVRKQSKRTNLFAPILLGAFTVFIPCGTTQAMMALAITSGSPLLGALILFIFILGTSPLFFSLGYFVTRLGESLHQKFTAVAAAVIILLAMYNLSGAIALTGANVGTSAGDMPAAVVASTEPSIDILDTGYSPSSIAIKAGAKINLHIKNTGGQGCSQAFTIPTLRIQKIIPIGTADTITFTAPEEKGTLTFMCSMGMYRGVMNVI